jgi:methanogenic corrinoid protein MtbC1
VVEPTRSEGGQRLYSDADIERLSLLNRVTDEGRTISSVAELSLDDLRRMAREDREARSPATAEQDDERLREFHDAAMEAVEGMDADLLETELRRALVVLGVGPFTDDLLAPFLREIGDRWVRGELRPAHEHVATAVVKRVLNWMIDPPRPDRVGPVAVVGTLAGEQHELGALLAAATAALEGWRVTFLGRDLPASDVALAARTLDARLVAVSVVHPVDAADVTGQLGELLEGLPDRTKVFVGGAPAADLVLALGDDRLDAVTNLAEFRAALRDNHPSSG